MKNKEIELTMKGISKYDVSLKVNKEFNMHCDISNREEVVKLFNEVLGIGHQSEEVLGMITVGVAGEVTGAFEVSRGTAYSTQVHPREIYKRAVLDNAV